VAKNNVVHNTRAAPTCIMDSEDEDILEETADIPDNNEIETEEAILAR
jgi:hypothetical protein